MATFTPNYHATFTTGVAVADIVTILKPVNQVRITNQGTVAAYVRVYAGDNATAQLTAATATPAVGAANENQVIPAGTTKVVFKTPTECFVALSVVAASAQLLTVEGTVFFTN